MTARLILNIVAVCGLGTLTGVLLTIGLTLGTYWQNLAPAAFLDWFAQNGHLVGRTVPVALLPAFLGLVASLCLGWPLPQQRYLWTAALACIVALLVLTAIYNGPMNGQFASRALAPEQVPAMLRVWLTSHAARTALSLIATILAALALARAG